MAAEFMDLPLVSEENQQAQIPAADQETIDGLKLIDIKDTPVTFGKTHLGKSHEEVWHSDPEWVKWFMSHYQKSTRMEHRLMIKFIQLKVEESEAGEAKNPQACIKPKGLPKSLAAKAKSMPSPSNHWQLPVEPEIEAFEMMSEGLMPPHPETTELAENVHALQERMLNLENAMQRMIALMSQSANHQMQNTHAMPTHETAQVEFDDPWNP
ncbi:unnamed protein product [Cladocopium goreaui]|uniref:CCHC-type domain-containing protein n=1 Tax=Cladocopium goreaui TaxID=2562237 RepID=A0A9P1D1B7_9DINO|nr:unnamed protein product [Cladocopium goreaui]